MTDKGLQVKQPPYLVLMISNFTREGSFSKLKIFENDLRTSMTQSRLIHLTVMSMECDILRELDFTTVIRISAAREARKVSV